MVRYEKAYDEMYLFVVRYEKAYDDYSIIMVKALADRLAEVILSLHCTSFTLWSFNIIQMIHDGECDMLKYICPSVEMSTRGCSPSVGHFSFRTYVFACHTRHHASFVLSHH